jgi:hypothetical protein
MWISSAHVYWLQVFKISFHVKNSLPISNTRLRHPTAVSIYRKLLDAPNQVVVAELGHVVCGTDKFMYSTIQVSDVLVLTVHCKLIHFVFQIFPHFVPEMPAGFTSYIVSYPHLFGLDPVTLQSGMMDVPILIFVFSQTLLYLKFHQGRHIVMMQNPLV